MGLMLMLSLLAAVGAAVAVAAARSRDDEPYAREIDAPIAAALPPAMRPLFRDLVFEFTERELTLYETLREAHKRASRDDGLAGVEASDPVREASALGAELADLAASHLDEARVPDAQQWLEHARDGASMLVELWPEDDLDPPAWLTHANQASRTMPLERALEEVEELLLAAHDFGRRMVAVDLSTELSSERPDVYKRYRKALKNAEARLRASE